MPIPTDTLFSSQWHLQNRTAGLLDLNLLGAWNPAQGTAYTGAGIRTVVIDDGFDFLHSDLSPNYNSALDRDYNLGTTSAFGLSSNPHGTAVAGIIGADNNGTGAVGVAFDTELVGFRAMLFSELDNATSDAALVVDGDVVNMSLGSPNSLMFLRTSELDTLQTAIGTATSSGRGGLGMTIVKSAGNSRTSGFDVNAGDWENDTRQVLVAAVDRDGDVSSYSSYGAANLVSGFGTPGQVVTTDRVGSPGYSTGNFTTTFNGTSSAAPMVTGVVGLMYDANEALGWRDVQSILAASARHVGTDIGSGFSGSERYAWGWNNASTWNGGGQHFSNDYGYGLVDGTAAVRLAESWLLSGPAAGTTANQHTNTVDVLNSTVTIPDGNTTGRSFSGTIATDDVIDRVTVQARFSTTFTGDVDIYLTSPDGTVSHLIDNAGGTTDFNGVWTFESQAFRGERAAGIWSVRVVDSASSDTLSVSDLVIRTHGTTTTADRYVFTNEYSDYDGVSGHATLITDPNGGTDTANASAVTSASTIRLDGVAGSIDGVAVRLNGIENAIGGDAGDSLVGSSVANSLFGMRGNDTLSGGDAADVLRGGTGNDNLIGGAAADILIGGQGQDLFRLLTSTDSLVGTRDIIRAGDSAIAFEGAGAAAGDRIDVSVIDANTTLSGNQTFGFGTTTTTGRVWLTNSGTNTLVNFNNDADTAIDFQLVIEDGTTLASAYSAADFIL